MEETGQKIRKWRKQGKKSGNGVSRTKNQEME
jgi:hypothetical protein